MLIFNRIFVIQTNTKMYSFICSLSKNMNSGLFWM